jgi:hypothetical protein
MSLTQDQLIQAIATAIQPNGNNQITAAIVRDVMIQMVSSMFPSVASELSSIPSYNSNFAYQPAPNIFVIHNNRIWRFVSNTSQQGVEPGTNPAVWAEVGFSELSHPQNTDFKVNRYGAFASIDSANHEIALYDPIYDGINTIFISENNFLNAEVTFRTMPPAFDLDQIRNYRYTCFVQDVPGLQPFQVSTNAFQDVPGGFITLGPGDWVRLEGAVDGKTRIIGSNKITGSGGASFDQALNTFNNVIFNTLQITQRAGDPDDVRVAVYDENGQLLENETISNNELIFSQIKFIDQATTNITTWQVINEQFVRVS